MYRTFSRSACLLAMLAAILLPRFATAGAWLRPVKSTYVQASVFAIPATSEFQIDGSIRKVREHSELTVQLYGEHGLLPWLTLVGNIDVFRRFTSGLEVNLGPGDAQLGVRVPLSVPFTAAIEMLAILPTGSIAGENPRLPLGYGTVGAIARLAVGRGFSRGWVTGDAGVQQLGLGAPPTLLASVGGGFKPLEKLRLELAFRVVQPLGLPREPVPEDRYTNRFDAHYLGYSIQASYRIHAPLWLGVGLEGGDGAQVPNSPNLKASISAEF